jgi:hypothetical protein
VPTEQGLTGVFLNLDSGPVKTSIDHGTARSPQLMICGLPIFNTSMFPYLDFNIHDLADWEKVNSSQSTNS